MEQIGMQLCFRRKKLKLTQTKVAKELELTNVTISQIELGNRMPSKKTYDALDAYYTEKEKENELKNKNKPC